MSTSRRGTVLVIVLWIALGLVTVALYFAHSARLAYLASDNSLAGIRSEQAIDGAVRYVEYVLTTQNEAGKLPSLVDGDYIAEEVPVVDARFWILGRDHNAAEDTTAPVYGLVDEASKLNINTAPLEMIELLPNMTPELAAAIVDWRDEDTELNAEGAESQDYLLLDDPYIAKDSAFETPEELRLLSGADLLALYGEDVNRNGILDPNEDDGNESWPDDDSDGELDAGVIEYITTFTREPNRQEDGSPCIVLGQAGILQRLAAELAGTLGPEKAGQTLANIGGAISSIDSPLEFYVLSGLTATDFALVEEALSAQSGDYRIGLTNVNTAPVAVLRCLPGVTEELASEIIAGRMNRDDETLSSIAWLADVVPADVADLIGPHVTTKSYQFSADIVAVGQGGRGFRRTLVVVDYETEPKVIYRRDLSRFGNPLPPEVREQVALAQEAEN